VSDFRSFLESIVNKAVEADQQYTPQSESEEANRIIAGIRALCVKAAFQRKWKTEIMVLKHNRDYIYIQYGMPIICQNSVAEIVCNYITSIGLVPVIEKEETSPSKFLKSLSSFTFKLYANWA